MGALGALVLGAAPAWAQRPVAGFARSDQSDVAGVSLTSSDLVNWERGTAKSFTCPVAWGVRTAGTAIESDLRAGTGLSPSVDRQLLLLLTGAPGHDEAATAIAVSLTPEGNSTRATRTAARNLVRALDGLLARTGRMDPASPGIQAPTQTNQAVSRYNDFVDASTLEFLESQPPALRGIHDALARVVGAAVANEGRASDAGTAGGLACAPLVALPVVAPVAPVAPVVPVAFTRCVMQPSGPVSVNGFLDTTTGDSTAVVDGVSRPFREAYPVAGMDASAAEWYFRSDPIMFRGEPYIQWGGLREMAPGSLTLAGEYGGVDVYTPRGVDDARSILVPVGDACSFREYRAREEVKVRG